MEGGDRDAVHGVKDWLAAHLPESATVTIGAIGAWWTQRGSKLRSLARRVTKLENDRVTREHVDELRESLNASIAHNQIRTEERLDRIWEHLANGGR